MRSDYHHLESVDSTQTFSKKNVSSFDRDAFTVVTSEEQSNGRGRLNRHWYSPKGSNLYTTYCFTLPEMPHSSNPITLVLALSISEVLQKLGLSVQIKWPNDLYIQSKKMGGILAEVVSEKDTKQAFLGFGLNVNLTADALNTQEFEGTSLLIETKRQWDLKTLAASIETTFKRDLEIFIQKGFLPFQKSFEGISFFHGKTIRLDVGNEVLSGSYQGVNEDGALLLKLPNSEIKAFLSGEIIGWE